VPGPGGADRAGQLAGVEGDPVVGTGEHLEIAVAGGAGQQGQPLLDAAVGHHEVRRGGVLGDRQHALHGGARHEQRRVDGDRLVGHGQLHILAVPAGDADREAQPGPLRVAVVEEDGLAGQGVAHLGALGVAQLEPAAGVLTAGADALLDVAGEGLLGAGQYGGGFDDVAPAGTGVHPTGGLPRPGQLTGARRFTDGHRG
jgi:hypothetical protein